MKITLPFPFPLNLAKLANVVIIIRLNQTNVCGAKKMLTQNAR